MRGLLLTLAILFGGPAVRACDDEPLPVVVEAYDVIFVVHEQSNSRSWEVSRLYFVRQGRVIADRIVCDDMLWSMDRGQFLVCWNDYGNCYRVIRAAALYEQRVDLDDLDCRSTDHAPWWGMGRRMTDLEAPR